MAGELDNMYDNKIYEIIKKINVREGHFILRSVWSYRRKATPDGVIFRHRSRLCADESTQKFDIDYNESYSSVVSHVVYLTYYVHTWENHWMILPQGRLYSSFPPNLTEQR